MKTPILISLLFATGCATSGLGLGELRRHGQVVEPIAFSWFETSPEQGRVDALARDGERFDGPFMQAVASQVDRRLSRAELLPLERLGTSGAMDEETVYSGRVEARLRGDRGHELRCEFTLVVPKQGMNGGARGNCRNSDGEVVSALFPARG